MTRIEPCPSAASKSKAHPVLRPTAQQLAWQRSSLGVFFHIGVNTFAGQEWSDGTLPASSFDPESLDADEWARTARDLGARYVVLTAKHHDGFCLWPTATTDYSVAASPWRNGRGDVVRDVAEAAARHGLGLGLYLSPWDRHEPCYPDAAAYDEFYLRQLRELCTSYGPLTELWFDGAGSAGRTYDWERIGALIGELQPHAMVFNMGPATIRWAGNEDGLAADPCRYVTTSADLNAYDDDTIELAEPRYLPPECDVSLRTGWFWQAGEHPKSVEHLLAIYDRSIGLGANLLLNIPPDRRGRIDPADAERIAEFRAALDARFGSPMRAALEQAPAGPDAASRVRAVLPAPSRFDHVELQEQLEDGQHVRAHRVLAEDGTVLAAGGTIGVRRIHRLRCPVQAAAVLVEAEGAGAVIDAVIVHDAEGAPVPRLPESFAASTEVPRD